MPFLITSSLSWRLSMAPNTFLQTVQQGCTIDICWFTVLRNIRLNPLVVATITVRFLRQNAPPGPNPRKYRNTEYMMRKKSIVLMLAVIASAPLLIARAADLDGVWMPDTRLEQGTQL
jgi:hypothetical protein